MDNLHDLMRPPFFLLAFFIVVFGVQCVTALRVFLAHHAWFKARIEGLTFSGDFPHVSIRRDRASFELTTSADAKGVLTYKQSYIAPNVDSRTLATTTDVMLQEVLKRARGTGLEFSFSSSLLFATCRGVVTPKQATRRLDAFETVLRALPPSLPAPETMPQQYRETPASLPRK